ncbi:MAG TPA: peptidylprolyl isomerase [Nitrospiria bacterium]
MPLLIPPLMKRLKKLTFYLMLGTLLLLSFQGQGCEGSSSTQNGNQEKTPPPSLSLDSQSPLSPETVAIVNTAKISSKEFDLLASQYESMNPEGFGKMSEIEKKEFFSKILNDLVTKKLLLQKAQEAGIEIPDELVDHEYLALQSSFPSEEAFLEVLKKGKTNPLLWKKGARETFIIQKLEESISKDIEVPENEIQNYWESYQVSFRKDQVHARHILTRTEAEAKQVLASLKRGTPFESTVKQFSVDPMSRNIGGDLGWILRGSSFEDFEKVVFSLEPQSISPPVKGRYGYHIVQVLGKKSAQEISLKDVREKISQIIRQQKWYAQRESWINGLKEKASIQIDPDYLTHHTSLQNVLKTRNSQKGPKDHIES